MLKLIKAASLACITTIPGCGMTNDPLQSGSHLVDDDGKDSGAIIATCREPSKNNKELKVVSPVVIRESSAPTKIDSNPQLDQLVKAGYRIKTYKLSGELRLNQMKWNLNGLAYGSLFQPSWDFMRDEPLAVTEGTKAVNYTDILSVTVGNVTQFNGSKLKKTKLALVLPISDMRSHPFGLECDLDLPTAVEAHKDAAYHQNGFVGAFTCSAQVTTDQGSKSHDFSFKLARVGLAGVRFADPSAKKLVLVESPRSPLAVLASQSQVNNNEGKTFIELVGETDTKRMEFRFNRSKVSLTAASQTIKGTLSGSSARMLSGSGTKSEVDDRTEWNEDISGPVTCQVDKQ